jgi:subtilisin-like proprotein convertase family protein
MTALLTALLLGGNAHALPAQFNHQGRLLDSDGGALEGDATITFRVTNAESGGDTLWEETLTVPLNSGFYSAILGADEEDNPLDIEVLSQAPVWLELQLDGEGAMFPRSPINAVPYATMATVAEEVSGGPVDASQIAVDGTPVVNELGEWVGPAPTVSWSAIEGIPEDFADGVDDDTISDTDSFAVLGTSCLDGDIPVWDSVVEDWTCDIDQDTLAGLGCLDGQLIHWNSDSVGWICADDADTLLTEDEVDAMVADNGYALTTDVFSGSFSDLSGVPAGLEDGDDNTQLTEDQVDDYVFDNGYAMASEIYSGSFLDLVDVPAGLDDGDDDNDTLGTLDCSDGQLAIWSETAGTWGCEDASGGSSGETAATLTVGSSDGGIESTSSDTPIIIPDDNAEGISSIQFMSSFDEVQTVTVDVEMTHPDMSQITIKLYSPPPGPVVTLYEGGAEGEANLNTNFGWVTPIASGDIYSFHNGEDISGTWRLQVIDEGAGGTGTLDDWTLHFNEEWEGTVFVGESITVPGSIEVRDELRVARGAELVFTDINGDETARLDGHGIVPPGGIIMWSGSEVPDGWALCDGTEGTPNLSDRFIVASGTSYTVGATGEGSVDVSTGREAVAKYWSYCGWSDCDKDVVGSVSVTNPIPKYYALAFIMRL